MRYDDVPAGSYVFRVVARSQAKEKVVVRRIIHIGTINFFSDYYIIIIAL